MQNGKTEAEKPPLFGFKSYKKGGLNNTGGKGETSLSPSSFGLRIGPLPFSMACRKRRPSRDERLLST